MFNKSEHDNLSRILAIDYGAKRIGLALCDPLKTFAYPYATIMNDDSTFKELKKIITEQGIEKIILGNPLREDGQVSRMLKPILDFKTKLEKDFSLEVILVDESYSSSTAQERIIASVPKKSKRREKGLIDKNAAAVILQEYLLENEH
ncbi:MAG: Holliday junction resolvase RuvX [Ignavibacteria bacterium]|nr:Holliday junction resolvase RuvX [Ignavibacteria bacterium]